MFMGLNYGYESTKDPRGALEEDHTSKSRSCQAAWLIARNNGPWMDQRPVNLGSLPELKGMEPYEIQTTDLI